MSLLSLVARRRVALSPPGLLALLYAGLILAGSALLMLPWATRAPIGWGDALFTAASAVTVTGLVVVDTGSAFTPFGQGVILALIQLGGLGLMTFATLVLSVLGLPIGLPHRIFLREDLQRTSLDDLLRLVAVILRVVLIFELAGAALLALVFVPAHGLAAGLWSAVFHSVSAFCNAGFSLYPDSLSRWVGTPLVNLVVPALFIAGGLGYGVLADLWRERGWRRLTLHSKLTLIGYAALLLAPLLAIAALEWTNPATLGGLDWGAKLWASWFQSATTRTAGFNTIDVAGLRESTSVLFMGLMFVGGGSTSTAGGIKVTTLVVLLLATAAFFRRREAPHAFGRSLGREEVMKVLALAMMSVLTVAGGFFLLLVLEEPGFVDLAFETVSAFGTVGLSQGATGELGAGGRGVVILLMFLGRVGPLTLGLFLATRTRARIRYPSSRVYLG